MTLQWKRRLIKEGLTLVVCLGTGFLVPLLLVLLLRVPAEPHQTTGDAYRRFLSYLPPSEWAMFEDRLAAWAFVLGPYVMWQFVRSIIWAVKARHARGPEKGPEKDSGWNGTAVRFGSWRHRDLPRA